MTSISMNKERLHNRVHEYIHPDDAEVVYRVEMQLVGVWFGKDQGLNQCSKCDHGIEVHSVAFRNPVGSSENQFEWIACSMCAEGDKEYPRNCFGEQA